MAVIGEANTPRRPADKNRKVTTTEGNVPIGQTPSEDGCLRRSEIIRLTYSGKKQETSMYLYQRPQRVQRAIQFTFDNR